MTIAQFLEQVPPSTPTLVNNLYALSTKGTKYLLLPDIQLHCGNEFCKGTRIFTCIKDKNNHDFSFVSPKDEIPVYVKYRCRNCAFETKLYSLLYFPDDTDAFSEGRVMKLGEMPFFGPPLPTRIMNLIGGDRELFLQGRRAENNGLGIGAFAYYRRVVENEKGRMIGEIAKVAKRAGASPDVLARFEAATHETQFHKAVHDVKDIVPSVLLMNGHNPLVLLHGALSERLHAGTDEECLELAHTIRLVLTELADRITQALKDDNELKQAISKLMQAKGQ